MASKQPWKSDLTSDLKFVDQTYILSPKVLHILYHLDSFGPSLNFVRKKKNQLTSTKVVSFAATKKSDMP